MRLMSVISGKDIIDNADNISIEKRDIDRIDPDGYNVVKMSIGIRSRNREKYYRVVMLAKMIGNKHPEEVKLSIPNDLYSKIVKHMDYEVDDGSEKVN